MIWKQHIYNNNNRDKRKNDLTKWISLFSLKGQLCTFAWVVSLLGRYLYNFKQRKLPCLLLYVDMRILIDKSISICLKESLIICTHGNVLLSLTLKKTQFQTILLYTYCRNTYPKGRALMKMNRVIRQTKRGNCRQ